MAPKKRAPSGASSGASSKRAKASSTADATAAAPPDPALASFARWCSDRGVEIHPALEFRNVAPPGATHRHNAVFAAAPVAPGDVLCRIPKSWCLTARTGSITSVLPSSVLADLDEAGLILAVMYERALGECSPWAPYFACLPPDAEPLPYLWPNERAAEWLEGTEVFARLVADAPLMREDHRRIMDVCREHAATLRAFFPDGVAPEPKVPAKVLGAKEDDEKATRDEDDSDADSDSESEAEEAEDGPAGYRAFLAAASFVASRAFQVDARNGQGLVPVADLFNHRGGGGEHVHVEGDDEDEDDADDEGDDDSDDFANESDEEGLEEEMMRLRGEDGEATFEEFEASAEDAVPADPLRKPLVPGPVAYDEDELDDDANVAGLDAGCDGYLTLTATRAANVGEELFNTFGDHGNALLLHKYGFAEWDNDAGGVTISPEIVGELLGFEVFAEALEALDGDGDGDGEDDSDEDEDEGSKKNAGGASPSPSSAVAVSAANTSVDGIPAGAAAARAAGWSGGLYEISPDGEPSRDLLMLFAVALADPDDPNACDPATGLPPNVAAPDSELLRLPGVAEATLAAIKARGETLPEGTVEGDLEKAREAARRDGRDVAAGGGACGEAAALLLRSQERAVCERAFVGLVDRLRAELGGQGEDEDGDEDGDGDKKEKEKKKKDENSKKKGGKRTREGVAGASAPLQDTPYGSIVYLPRRGRTERDER